MLVSSDPSDPNRANLAKIADFYDVKQIEMPPSSADYSIVIRQKDLGLLSGLAPARSVLVYDCCQNSDSFKVFCCSGNNFHIGEYREFTHQLSGLSITTPSSAQCEYHVFTAFKSADVLIRLGDHPFLIHEKRNGCDWFYLGGKRVAYLDSPLKRGDFTLDSVFPELIPFALFFQHLCAPRQNPLACLIIDDPSLRRRYGFLDYNEVANLLRKEQLALTIAFIPWNYRKSVQQVIDLFLNNQENLSICVHGCDHTAGEFGTASERVLSEKIGLARKRMDEHKERFGLPYDNVMIFPQGIFSEESMEALKKHGFLATVNSSLLASNYQSGLTIRDLISPATCHYGLPLFLRRYPKRIEDFAYDLFFGRPALIVQHNIDFVEGWNQILSFINSLKRLEPNLQWLPLGRLVEEILGINQCLTFSDKCLEHPLNCDFRTYLKSALRRNLCDIRDNVFLKSQLLRSIIKRCHK